MLKLVHKHFSSKRLSFVLLVLGKPNSTLVLTCLSYVKPPSIGWSYSLANEWKSIKFPEVLGKGNFQLILFFLSPLPPGKMLYSSQNILIKPKMVS